MKELRHTDVQYLIQNLTIRKRQGKRINKGLDNLKPEQ